MRFTVEEKVEWMELCGCKHSTNKPFCDGETCKCLREGKQVKRIAGEEKKELEGEKEAK